MNSSFLRKGEEIRPVLLERRVGPLSCVRIAPDPKAYQGWGVTEDEPWSAFYPGAMETVKALRSTLANTVSVISL